MTEVKVRRRSYSQLDLYLKCPEQYMWKYVERIPEDPAVWSIGGTAFHTVAERYLRGELGEEPNDYEVHQAWLNAWEDARDEVIARNPEADPDVDTWRKANRGKEDALWWEVEGEAMVRRFLAWRRREGHLARVLHVGETPALELRLEVELGGVPVVAIPDAVVVDEHGQVDILDYKSSKDQRGPAGSLQLGVYKAALLVSTGLEAQWGLYYMTRSAAVLPRPLAQWTPDLIGDMFADFDTRANAGDYPPKPGDACKFCPFKKNRCSFYKKETA